eukprot:scaffold1807_cov140-Cylindrotheca_fusiformis.AAC.26
MGISTIASPPVELRWKPKVHRKKLVTKAKRRVRLVKFDDERNIEYKITPRCGDKSSLWWTRDERKDILENNQRLARQFRCHHRDEISHANDVFDQCCYDDSPLSSTEWSAPKVELPTHVRGLEWAILPKSKSHRRVHVQEVLEAQDDDDMAEFAVESSRACVAFARILGQSDAQSAKPSFVPRRRPRMIPSCSRPSAPKIRYPARMTWSQERRHTCEWIVGLLQSLQLPMVMFALLDGVDASGTWFYVGHSSVHYTLIILLLGSIKRNSSTGEYEVQIKVVVVKMAMLSWLLLVLPPYSRPCGVQWVFNDHCCLRSRVVLDREMRWIWHSYINASLWGMEHSYPFLGTIDQLLKKELLRSHRGAAHVCVET